MGPAGRRAYLTHPFNRSVAQSEVVGLQDLLAKTWKQRWRQRLAKWPNAQHIAMTGISFGGIQTILTAEKGLGIDLSSRLSAAQGLESGAG